METNKTILQELALLSPLLASKRPGHPYQVPESYFDAFPGSVLDQLPINLPSSALMPMDVPTGYFNGLSSSILAKIKAANVEQEDELSEVIAKISKTMPYTVPSGYFESLDNQLAPILWNESAPSVLTMIGRKMPYIIPEGYFKSFPSLVLNKLKDTRKQGQVYPMSFVRKVYRYAAAAVLVGIVSVGTLMYLRNEPAKSSPVAATNLDIKTISNDELQSYISGLDLNDTDSSVIVANSDLQADDLKEFLNDMPDQALQQYVQEYAQSNIN